MGANDAAEMLEVAKEECGRLERELAAEKRDAALAEKHWHRDQADLRFIVGQRDAALARVAEQKVVIERVRKWTIDEAFEVSDARLAEESLPVHADHQAGFVLGYEVASEHVAAILSASGIEALEARHTIKQIPPWSASPSAKYLTGAFECSCGEKFLFLDSRHNPEWREDKRRIAEEHAALANRKSGEQSNG